MKSNCILMEVFTALVLVMLQQKGFAYPTDEKFVGEYQSQNYALPNLQDMDLPHINYIPKPKSCFHFYVSRNMSSLLSDATKMLQQVHDRHEREWILTFIYRIKSLTEHLRTHPESRNYDCLTTGEDDESLRNHLRIPQQELYFVDDMIPNSNHKRSDSTQEDPQQRDTQQSPEKSTSNASPEHEATVSGTSTKPENAESVASETSSEHKVPDEVASEPISEQKTLDTIAPESSSKHKDPENVSPASGHSGENIVLSSTPDCEANTACERALNKPMADGTSSSKIGTTNDQSQDQLVQEVQVDEHQHVLEEDRRQQRLLKQRIRKALLEEMAPEVKKLRTVGGSEEDLINLWRQTEDDTGKSPETPHYQDFDYEEIGAAAGDLTSSDGITTNDHTVAPSLGDIKNLKRQPSHIEAGSTKSYEPYDDSDVLVKQLFDVRFEQASTAKSAKFGSVDKVADSATVPY